jgi:hypothetical protein
LGNIEFLSNFFFKFVLELKKFVKVQKLKFPNKKPTSPFEKISINVVEIPNFLSLLIKIS